MKKTGIILICTLLTVLSCILFAGCSKEEQVTAIELKDSATAIEVQIGRFDYSEYTLLVTYNSGSVVELALSEDMISELDRLKLYQPGDHVITVSYGGQSCEVGVSVRRNTFGNIKFRENNVFTYDGKAHTVEIEGELPANATVSYPGGNSFINAGTYDVTAVISCNGYETEKVTTTVTIERAKYDMSGVKFESEEVVYNGKAHSVSITGTLPKGVSAPTYYINGNKTSSATDADVYEVTAVFSSNDPNYEPIPNMEATLRIIPAEHQLDGMGLVFENENGAWISSTYKVYDGVGVKCYINLESSISKNFTVAYTVYNENGEVISLSNDKTNIKNAGKYTVKVEFLLYDSKNYKSIEPREFKFEVLKAQYDLTGLRFDSESVVYDGGNHSLFVTFPKTFDHTQVDVEYFYILGGETVTVDGVNAKGVSNAGEYTVRAEFTVKDPNYDGIDPVEATLVIERMKISSSDFEFDAENGAAMTKGDEALIWLNVNDLEGLKYTAELYKVDGDELILIKEVGPINPDSTNTVSIDFDTSKLEVGKYVCVALVSTENSNYVWLNGNLVTEYYLNFEVIL